MLYCSPNRYKCSRSLQMSFIPNKNKRNLYTHGEIPEERRSLCGKKQAKDTKSREACQLSVVEVGDIRSSCALPGQVDRTEHSDSIVTVMACSPRCHQQPSVPRQHVLVLGEIPTLGATKHLKEPMPTDPTRLCSMKVTCGPVSWGVSWCVRREGATTSLL